MSACSSCSAPIRWAVTGAGARIPLDPDPVADGNLVIEVDTDPPEVRFVSKARPAPDGAARFVTHFATCPNAASHRKKAR